MNNQEILKQAIEKAVENGWNPLPDNLENSYRNIMANWYHVPIFIFSHDFAKAFWGEEQICEICEEGNISPLCPFGIDKRWQYHLKEMVTEEGPIKYLEQFL